MDTMPEKLELGNAHNYKNHRFFIGLFHRKRHLGDPDPPPFGDEPQGYAIIAIGIIIPVLVQYIAQIDDRQEA
jgi:hypothetical protein